MTGFGKANHMQDGKGVSIEMRSVNSKSLDLNFRLPSNYREKESEIKNLVSEKLKRGKIDLIISVDAAAEAKNTLLDKEQVKFHYNELKSLCTDLQIEEPNLLQAVLRMPDIFKTQKEQISEKEWEQVFVLIKKAVSDLDSFRIAEGKSLEKDLSGRINEIATQLVVIEDLDKARIPGIKEKLRKQIAEFTERIDENRLEQELIYYAEKLDITEEKVRLKTHCTYFLKTMSEPECGRKLNFISQEIGREINTIGSKANDAAIQKVVVQMKDELEKIKEQLSNVL